MHARRSHAAVAALAFAAASVAAAPLASTAASRPAASHAGPQKRADARAPHKRAQTKPSSGYHPHSGPAPADEYFGRLGMSILGVRNKVKDLGLQADTHPDQDKMVLSNALWVEDAMRDWAKKYPFDHWLPRYAYALEQMYERIPGDDAHKRAMKQISYLTAYFPQTVYGKVGRAKLAEGVPTPDPSDSPEPLTDLQRLALLDGKVLPTIPPAVTPTPIPSPPPATLPEGPPSPAASPSPSPAPPSATARP